MTHRTIMVVVGTRPEVIKLAPVYREALRAPAFTPILVSTGQHREMVHDALAANDLEAHHDLDLMSHDQTPTRVLERALNGLDLLLEQIAPAAVVVQGDTTTVLAASLAAFHRGVPIGHVEAGLRTYDLANPYPEEGNRQMVDRISRWCFAPTDFARRNLIDERIPATAVHVTGNTAVDALLWASHRSSFRCPPNTLLITLHRRESFEVHLEQILLGVQDALAENSALQILWPVHPNPNVQKAARHLASSDRVHIVPPLGYLDFVGALQSCRVVLSDSGGVQEEAPSLGKRVLIARDTTERPEAVTAGLNVLVGRGRRAIRDRILEVLELPFYEGTLPAFNPYGDGNAASRIIDVLVHDLTNAS